MGGREGGRKWRGKRRRVEQKGRARRRKRRG
jgi:hypothetical protein